MEVLGAFRKGLPFYGLYWPESKCKIQRYYQICPWQNSVLTKMKLKEVKIWKGEFCPMACREVWLQGERVGDKGITESWVFPFLRGWCWSSSSGKGNNLGHHDGRAGGGDWSSVPRIEGIYGENDEETVGEEDQDGADDKPGLVMLGW